MCGIAGMAGAPNDGGVDRQAIHRMCQTLIHRGPDDEGIYVKEGVGLGMRRLSVIDLAGGHQPVFNEDKTIWMVFNGEIYNFKDLRRELESKGHRFYTHSDTEVIVHLYEDMGSDCVKKLRGMFAFALYDQRSGCLLLARDRLGKKPLHYAVSNDRLLFGSEIKAILASQPELAETSNPQALLQYFYFGYIPDPLTAFAGIAKLPPGHILKFQKGKVELRQYWDLPKYGTYSPASEEDCLEELEERLSEAIRIRMVADVPLGAMLSGGTDSSTVVGLMARASSRPIKTFSIGFRQADFDESHYARLVAQKFGTDHHELILDPNIFDTVEKLTRTLEEPFGDSSMLPTYYISCLAREHVTVALSGDGGDEAFAGYERYRIQLGDQSFGWIPNGLKKIYRDEIYARLPDGVPGRNLAYRACLQWQERYIEAVSLTRAQRDIGVLSSDFLSQFSDDESPSRIFQKYLDEAPADDALSGVLYLDTKTYLPGDILTKVDRMSMLASLEARVPLLDHVLLEWVTSLTPKWKMGAKGQKYILRKLAARIGVPNEVLHRPKQGFALPLVHWIRHELKDLILTVMLEPRTLQRGYFNSTGIKRMLDEHFQGRRDHSFQIWRLLMFEYWHRNFLEQPLPPAHELQPMTSFSGRLG